MDAPAPDTRFRRPTLDRPARQTEAQERCPRCGGTGWIKSYTPWGCPIATACPCVADAAPHRSGWRA